VEEILVFMAAPLGTLWSFGAASLIAAMIVICDWWA